VRSANCDVIGIGRFIVHAVVWLYIGAIVSLILFLPWKGWVGDDHAFSSLFDLLKVAVLPVVTLVIGYYFGTEKSE
jgi:L-asparagine transporter-like permease